MFHIERSKLMSLIKDKNTKPEIIVRKLLFRMGYRFCLHRKDLPGKPDIVLPKYKTIIDVRGCFWHCHQDCTAGHIPNSNQSYWKPKLEKNVARDKANEKKLKELGWKVIVIWECETKNLDKLTNLLNRIQIEKKS